MDKKNNPDEISNDNVYAKFDRFSPSTSTNKPVSTGIQMS